MPHTKTKSKGRQTAGKQWADHCPWKCLKFLFKNINLFARDESKRLRWALITIPAVENTRSADTELPCMAKYFLACFNKLGNDSPLAFYQSSGFAVIAKRGEAMYLEISKAITSFLELLALLLEPASSSSNMLESSPDKGGATAGMATAGSL